MASLTQQEYAFDRRFDSVDLKSKVVVNHVELEADPTPPLADNFMYDFKFNHPLPTCYELGIEVPANCDAQEVAEKIVERLSAVMQDGDVKGFTDMFLEHGTSASNHYY